MQAHKINDKRHRFAPQIIAHVIWHCVRFNLSLREIEVMMEARGMNVSYEAALRWRVNFGPLIAHAPPTSRN